MLTDLFYAEMEAKVMDKVWYQPDRANCHLAQAAIDILRFSFKHQTISINGNKNWPAWSCGIDAVRINE